MYHSFSAVNFRGLKHLEIGPLGKVNLITGKNNVGKTALLEALWMHYGGDNADLGTRAAVFRQFEVEASDFMQDLFFDFNPENKIKLVATGDWGQKPQTVEYRLEERPISEISLSEIREGSQPNAQLGSIPSRGSNSQLVVDYFDGEIDSQSTGWLVERQISPGVTGIGLEQRRVPRPERPRAVYVPARRPNPAKEIADRFSELEISGQHTKLLTILKSIDPRISRLAVVSSGVTPTLYCDIGLGRLLPVPLVGDGMNRLIALALAIAHSAGGMVVVDEVENGLHHSVMMDVWKAISIFADDYNVQVFATTHSEECLRAAYFAFASRLEFDLSVIRLDRVRGEVKATMYDQEMLETAIESDLEIR